MVLDKYPDRKIEIIDSLAASSGYGLLMDILADKRDQGLSFEDLCAFALDIRNKVQHWFFSTDLTFYIKGGRVSKTAGFVGSMLNICPLLNVNIEGKLIPREKVRSKKKVSQRVVDIMEERALGGKDYSGKCFISQSACREDAEYVASLIEERFPKLKGKVMINDIGTTIGSHTGPGTVAVFYIGDQKDD
jgi:DegV family protein with EDD domain